MRLGFFGVPIVFSSFIGLVGSVGPFVLASLGVFVEPLNDAFGWNRAQVMLSATILSFAIALASPYTGKLMDSYGVKQILLFAIPSFSFLLVSFSFMDQLWHLYLITFLIGVLACACNSISYVKVIATWFNRRRGLMIGFAVAGIGVGFSIVPIGLEKIVSIYGWRQGYWVLGGLELFIVFPIILLFFKNSPAEMGLLPDGNNNNQLSPATKQFDSSGYSLSESSRMPEFWILVFALFVFSIFFIGLVPHIIPLFSDRGFDRSTAAVAAFAMGMSSLIARVVCGYLMDLFHAPTVSLVVFLLASCGIGMLALGSDVFSINLLAVILVGVGGGAENDLLGLMVSRYFGIKHFSRIYGVLFIAFIAGAGVGPLALGVVFNVWGSYIPGLIVGSVACVIASIAFCLMGRYRFAVNNEEIADSSTCSAESA